VVPKSLRLCNNKGFSQVEGIDFDKLFSPVVCYETTRLLLAVAILEDLDIQSIDIKTAYLYGNLDEEIYMEQPNWLILVVHNDQVNACPRI